MSKRDEYVATMKRQLDEWNAEMDALEAKAQEAQEAAKLKFQEQLSALRTQRLAGEKKLEAVQTATEDSWERLKGTSQNRPVLRQLLPC
jgi:chromosome segregation ATPase